MSLVDYQKIKVIGKGSYGEVWLAKHRRDKKQVVFDQVINSMNTALILFIKEVFKMISSSSMY